MKKTFLAVAIAAMFPAVGFAQDADSYRCTHGDLVRRVEILTEAGMAVPCEVHYHKDTEAPGEPQVLWSATNDATYCGEQTEAFVAKLRGWVWECSAAGGEAAPAEAAAPADDTATLTSADESEGADEAGDAPE